GDDVYAGGVSAAAAVTVEKAPPAVHRSTPGIYDPSSAHWYLRTDNSTGPADFGDFSFGVQGLIPLAGDYIYPDGREGLALYNPATGIWLLTDNGEAQKPFQFGPGGLPFTIDFNGDGKDGVGLYNNGTWIIGDDVITTFSFGV